MSPVRQFGWSLRATVDSESLALFRFVFCVSAMYAIVHWSIDAQLLYRYGVLSTPHIGSYTLTLGAFRVIVRVALVAAAFGLFPRTALVACLVAIYVFCADAIDFWGAHHLQLVFIVLCLLVITPGIGRHGLLSRRDPRRVPAWPLTCVVLLLSCVYFAAGLSKLSAQGLDWLHDPSVVQGFLAQLHIMGKSQFGAAEFLLAHPPLPLFISTGVVLFQMAFWLVLFFPGLKWPLVATGLAFHTSLYFVATINFMPYFLPVYWVFLFWPAPRAATCAISEGCTGTNQ